MGTTLEHWHRVTERAESFRIPCAGLNESQLDALYEENSLRGFPRRWWCCAYSMGCARPEWNTQELCENGALFAPKRIQEGGYPGLCKYHPEGVKTPDSLEPQTCVYDANKDYYSRFGCDNLCSGTEEDAKQWTKFHRNACCRMEGKFCETLIPEIARRPYTNKDKFTSKPLDNIQFNCTDGMSNPRQWSTIKRRWCYIHWSIGTLPQEKQGTTHTTTTVTTTTTTTVTTTSTTVGPHDCYSGVRDWVNQFPYKKKLYCCKFWERKETWPRHTRGQCCDYLGIGCDTTLQTTTSKPYDCRAGYFNWIKGWSPNKKVYCCREEGRGCIFDCSASYHHGDWKREWSTAKKAWCCLTERRGCPRHERRDEQVQLV